MRGKIISFENRLLLVQAVIEEKDSLKLVKTIPVLKDSFAKFKGTVAVPKEALTNELGPFCLLMFSTVHITTSDFKVVGELVDMNVLKTIEEIHRKGTSKGFDKGIRDDLYQQEEILNLDNWAFASSLRSFHAFDIL